MASVTVLHNATSSRLSAAVEDVDALIGALSEALVAVDDRGVIEEFNPAAENLTGLPRRDLIGRVHWEKLRVQVPKHEKSFADYVAAAIVSRGSIEDRRDCFLQHPDGRRVSLRARFCSRPTGGLFVLLEDISELTLLGEELEYRSTHDPLTGLFNREEFETRARAAVAAAQGGGKTSVLCYVDVDQFRLINDTLGHVAGDEMLHELAIELRSVISPGDILARLGGDEFGVLLLNRDLEASRSIVAGVLEAARRFRFAWQGETHSATVSLGVVQVDSGTPNVALPLSRADAACFLAKDSGRDRAHFAGEDGEIAHRHAQMSLVGKISRNLEEDRFVLHFEDVTDLVHLDRPVYRELLVRMRDDDGSLLTPAPLIQAAERFSLMGTLDRWVIRNAIQGLARVPADGVVYAVNLSGQSLGDERFLEFVLAELDNSGVDPARLCFEVTETAAVSRLSEAVRFMARLASRGCTFALDDFGAGMASFSYLKNFSVNYLKIDGSFVRAMLASRADRGMVESINRIGHELGLQTIAEHVETTELLVPLREIGVDYIQGRAIAFGRPFEELFSPAR